MFAIRLLIVLVALGKLTSSAALLLFSVFYSHLFICTALYSAGLCTATPIPEVCTRPRPKSGMDCDDANKTRRFYFSYRESRCKRFGICAQAALQYDEVTEINYFSSMAECEANCTNGKDVIMLQLADLHLYFQV